MESIEIAMAIKVGMVKLGYIYDVDLERTLKKLDINFDKDPITDDLLSKDLRILTEHGGDHSLIRYVENYDKNAISQYSNLRVMAFITGINYIYPPSSMEWIIKRWNDYFGKDFITISEYLDFAKKEWINILITHPHIKLIMF